MMNHWQLLRFYLRPYTKRLVSLIGLLVVSIGLQLLRATNLA